MSPFTTKHKFSRVRRPTMTDPDDYVLVCDFCDRQVTRSEYSAVAADCKERLADLPLPETYRAARR